MIRKTLKAWGTRPHRTKYDIQQKIKERELLKQNDDQNSKTS